jgi:hypothetical protein
MNTLGTFLDNVPYVWRGITLVLFLGCLVLGYARAILWADLERAQEAYVLPVVSDSELAPEGTFEFAGTPPQYDDVESDMVKYLRQFMYNKEQWERAHSRLETEMRYKLENVAQENAYNVNRMVAETARYQNRGMGAEYNDVVARSQEMTRAAAEQWAKERDLAVQRLARDEAEARAKVDAVPFWPYDVDKEEIGDGDRHVGLFRLDRPLGVNRPSTLVGVTAEEGA